MRELTLAFGFIIAVTAISMTGCGSGGSNTVVEPAASPGLAPEAQQSYEEAMKARSGRESN